MAYLGRIRKCDLFVLATELGETPNAAMTIVGLKELILKSDSYDEPLVKERLQGIHATRREEEEAEEKRQRRELELKREEEEAKANKKREEEETEERKQRWELELRKADMELKEREKEMIKDAEAFEITKRQLEKEFRIRKLLIKSGREHLIHKALKGSRPMLNTTEWGRTFGPRIHIPGGNANLYIGTEVLGAVGSIAEGSDLENEYRNQVLVESAEVGTPGISSRATGVANDECRRLEYEGPVLDGNVGSDITKGTSVPTISTNLDGSSYDKLSTILESTGHNLARGTDAKAGEVLLGAAIPAREGSSCSERVSSGYIPIVHHVQGPPRIATKVRGIIEGTSVPIISTNLDGSSADNLSTILKSRGHNLAGEMDAKVGEVLLRVAIPAREGSSGSEKGSSDCAPMVRHVQGPPRITTKEKAIKCFLDHGTERTHSRCGHDEGFSFEACIRLRNSPLEYSKEETAQLPQGLESVRNGTALPTDYQRRSTKDADVQWAAHDLTEDALGKRKDRDGSRHLKLRGSSLQIISSKVRVGLTHMRNRRSKRISPFSKMDRRRAWGKRNSHRESCETRSRVVGGLEDKGRGSPKEIIKTTLRRSMGNSKGFKT